MFVNLPLIDGGEYERLGAPFNIPKVRTNCHS